MKTRTSHAVTVAVVIAALLLTDTTGVPTEPSLATSEPCPVPLCKGPTCRGTKPGPGGCPVCDCPAGPAVPPDCPLVQCARGCRAEENAPEGRCPGCVCDAAPPYGSREVDVPCFSPLLREALRRLAEVEEQLHQLRQLTHENGLRLHRLLPPVEHPHHHHQPPHQPHHQHQPGHAASATGDGSAESDTNLHKHDKVKSGRVVSNTVESGLHADDPDDEYGGGSQEMPRHLHSHHHHPHHDQRAHHHNHHHGPHVVHHVPMERGRNQLLQREDPKELKLSETQYDFAICRLQPNTAIAKELQQPVQGLISLWQQKGGRDLNVHVHVTGLKVNESAQDHRAFMHGMHVHQLGNLSDSCQSTGPHFNPANSTHGDRREPVRHVGDFGNIACDKHGESNVIFTDTLASLTGPWSIVGRSINIHAGMDDLGRNPDNPESVSSGNSGPRVACCIIEKVDKLPQLSSKAAKRILRDIMQPFSDFESE